MEVTIVIVLQLNTSVSIFAISNLILPVVGWTHHHWLGPGGMLPSNWTASSQGCFWLRIGVGPKERPACRLEPKFWRSQYQTFDWTLGCRLFTCGQEDHRGCFLVLWKRRWCSGRFLVWGQISLPSRHSLHKFPAWLWGTFSKLGSKEPPLQSWERQLQWIQTCRLP